MGKQTTSHYYVSVIVVGVGIIVMLLVSFYIISVYLSMRVSVYGLCLSSIVYRLHRRLAGVGQEEGTVSCERVAAVETPTTSFI